MCISLDTLYYVLMYEPKNLQEYVGAASAKDIAGI